MSILLVLQTINIKTCRKINFIENFTLKNYEKIKIKPCEMLRKHDLGG
jgi:hypothetical protein